MRGIGSTYAIPFIALLIMAIPSHAKGPACIDWQKLMTRHAIESLPQGSSISVAPFKNYTAAPGDDWLSHGARDLLADMLRSASNIRVLAGHTAAGAKGNPHYSVTGSYQHANGMLRIFMTLSEEANGQVIKQLEALSPYPENKEIFIKMAEAAQTILKSIKAKYDSGALAAVRDATPSTRAYESFSRGRQALLSFSPSRAEVAETFFADAKRADYRSPLGYLGLIDLNSFMGFYDRQSRKPGTSHYQRAEAELSSMQKLVKAKIPVAMYFSALPGGKGGIPANRFLSANAYATESKQLELSGNVGEARETLKRALDIVPEDAMSWYYLSRMEASQGDIPAATAALRKAYEINHCIESR